MPGAPTFRLTMVALAFVGLAAVGIPAPAAAASRACPDTGLLTVVDLLRLAPSMGGASAGGYWGPNPRAHACFGSDAIRVRGFANWPDGIGGTSPTGVAPGYFEWPQLFLFSTSRETAPGYGRGPMYGIVVPPAMGRVENRFHRVWVDAVVQFGAPLANRCHGYGPKDLGRPTRKQAVAYCRDVPVLVSISLASGAPDTATDVPASASSPRPAGLLPGVELLALAAAGGLWASWRRIPSRRRARR